MASLMEAESYSGALIQGRCRNLVELRAQFTPGHPDTGLGIFAVASSVSRMTHLRRRMRHRPAIVEISSRFNVCNCMDEELANTQIGRLEMLMRMKADLPRVEDHRRFLAVGESIDRFWNTMSISMVSRKYTTE
jgi:hypothetical protein